MRRIEALEILNEITAELPVVVTCAATSRELASVEDRDNHFYVLDSMGLVGSITTGIAMAVEESPVPKVIGIEGDGSLLMNPNVLPTGGYLAPSKLMLVLLDNNVYGSTAGLPTYANRLDLAAIAEASGWQVGRADDLAAEAVFAADVVVDDRGGYAETACEVAHRPAEQVGTACEFYCGVHDDRGSESGMECGSPVRHQHTPSCRPSAAGQRRPLL